MASKRNRTPKEESELVVALKFIKAAQNDDGHAEYMKHCYFQDGQVVAFDGVLAAGYPVSEIMNACPRTSLLINALERVRGAYSMTQLDNASLVINSGAYRVNVPCEVNNMFPVQPDEPLYDIGDSFKEAAEKAATFCTDGAQTVLQASIITLANSLAGTDNAVIIEAWHGWGMPSGLLIPVSFVNALKKIEHKLVKFGWTPDRSLTFYFENGAWLRTQLYQEPVPDIAAYLSKVEMSGCIPFPADFFTALDAVQQHAAGNSIFIRDNTVCSHEVDELGAQYKCDGLPFTCVFNKKLMNKLRTIMENADFTRYPDRIVFTGKNVRAVMMKMGRPN